MNIDIYLYIRTYTTVYFKQPANNQNAMTNTNDPNQMIWGGVGSAGYSFGTVKSRVRSSIGSEIFFTSDVTTETGNENDKEKAKERERDAMPHDILTAVQALHGKDGAVATRIINRIA